MQCTCGFDNGPDAKFCGKCGLALGAGASGTVPHAAQPTTSAPITKGGSKAGGRPLSRALLATVALVVVVVAAAGYWWLNRPPGRSKTDNSGLFHIKVDGKYGFMDRAGKTVITPQFDLAGWFSEGLAMVQVGNKVGFVNTKGAVVITPQFDDSAPGSVPIGVYGFHDGRSPVVLGGRYGVIDKDGRYIHNPDLRSAGSFSEGLAPVTTEAGEWAFVDRSGKVVMSGKFEELGYFAGGLAPAKSGGKWGFIDTTGKWIINPQFSTAGRFGDGLAQVGTGGRFGYIDKKGKFVVNPQYDGGSGFSDGFAVVVSGEKWGFINTRGEVVVKPTFLQAWPFRDGLASVKTDDGWGYVDPTGKMVISPQFDSAGMFQNGLALVTLAGKEAYVTTTGAFVVDPFPDRGAVPAHPVQEVWEGYVKFSENSKSAVRFVLIRKGAQIRGFSSTDLDGRVGLAYDLKGQTAQDGSFSMVDELGRAWKGQFASALVIQGVWVKPNLALAEAPMRLRLVRDATAKETEPLPPTTTDWRAFLSSFKDAVRQRNLGALSLLTARSFHDANSVVLGTPKTLAEELGRVEWERVDAALVLGVESSSSTPLGRAQRLIVEEHPSPNQTYKVRLTFIQDGDKQWRWAYIDYPATDVR